MEVVRKTEVRSFTALFFVSACRLPVTEAGGAAKYVQD